MPCLLCPKYCLLCPIVKITHSDLGEKNHNWKIILKREKSRKNRKVQIDKIDFKESTNRRNLTQPWHASDNHTDPYQVSPLWLGLKVTDKPGPEYNADWLTMLTMLTILVLWPV